MTRYRSISLKAPNGTYVAPSVASTTAAGNTATVSQPINATALPKSLLNSSAPGTYPITTTTFVLTYSNYQQAGMSKDLAGTKSFLNYAYSSAAQNALNGIGNAPLPSTILSAAKAQVGTLH